MGMLPGSRLKSCVLWGSCYDGESHPSPSQDRLKQTAIRLSIVEPSAAGCN